MFFAENGLCLQANATSVAGSTAHFVGKQRSLKYVVRMGKVIMGFAGLRELGMLLYGRFWYFLSFPASWFSQECEASLL